MEPTQAEVAAKALVMPEATPPATLTSVDKMAARAHTTLTEKGFRETLRVEKEPVVDSSGITSLVEQFGTERNPTTGERIRTTKLDKERYKDTVKINLILNKFIEKGWKGTGDGALSGSERSSLMAWGRAELMRSPALAKELSALPGPKQEEFIERYMSRPETQAKLREAMAQIPENFQLDNTVDVKADAVAEKEIDLKLKVDEIAEIDKKIEKIEKSQARFVRDASGAPIATAAEAQRVDSLKISLSTIQTDVGRITADRDTAATDVRRLKEELRQAKATAAGRGAPSGIVTPGGGTTTPRGIPDINNELVAAESSLASEEAALSAKLKEVEGIGNSIKTIEAEQRALEAERDGLAKDRLVADAERGKAVLEVGKAIREYQEAKTMRTAQEQNIVNALREAFPNAIREVVNSDIDELTTIVEKQLSEAKEGAKTAAQKAALDTLRSSLSKKETKRRWAGKWSKERTVIDKEATDRVFNNLMASGPDAVMSGLIISSINPETGRLYTAAEAQALLKDKAFADSLRPQMVKQLLARKMITGGISKEDVFTISNSEWGQGLIDESIRNNEAFKKQIEDIYGQGALQQPGFAKRLLVEMGSKKSFWLTLLLGAGVLVAGYDAFKSGKTYA